MFRLRRAVPIGMIAFVVGASYAPFFDGFALAGRDLFRLGIPDAEFLLDCFRHHWLPLWNPYPRLGQPFAATLISQAFYPVRWIALLAGDGVRACTVEQMLHATIATAGAFVCARRLGASFQAAAIAAAWFGLGPAFLHLDLAFNLLSALAWSGWIAASALRLSRTRRIHHAAALCLFLGLSFLAGSPETWLWQSLLAIALSIASRAPRRSFAFAIIAAVASILLAGVVALPAAELTSFAGENGGVNGRYFWSASWTDFLGMAWPLVELPKRDYWNDQLYTATLHVGLVTCVLAGVAAMAGRRSREIHALTWIAALLGLLSLGDHLALSRWLLRVPPLAMFRFPAKYALGVVFIVCVLSARGFDRFAAWLRRVDRTTLITIATFGGAGLSLLAATWLLRIRPESTAKAGLVATAPLLILGSFVAAFWRGARSMAGRGAVLILWWISLSIGLRLWQAPLWLPQSELSAHSPLAEKIGPDPNRRTSVIDPQSDEEQPAGPDLDLIVSSRQTLTPLRFVEERQLAFEGYGRPDIVQYERFAESPTRSVYDLAAVRFFVRRSPPFPDVLERGRAAGVRLYESSTALPRTFLVFRSRRASDDEMLAAVRNAAEPFRTTAFVESAGPQLDSAPCSPATAAVIESEPNRVRISAEACAPSILVVSDQLLPGWSASVDGKNVPLYRADVLFRAFELPPGRHDVLMTYSPRSFWVGLALSLSTLLALGLIAVRYLRSQRSPSLGASTAR